MGPKSHTLGSLVSHAGSAAQQLEQKPETQEKDTGPADPKALEQVMPEIANIGFMADSVRIPTVTASLIILNVTFQTEMLPDGTAIQRDVDSEGKVLNEGGEPL